MARSGLANLLARLRTLTDEGTATYSDDDLALYLENAVTYVEDEPLHWAADRVAGQVRYHRASASWRDFEEAGSGTAYWRVTDSVGNEIGTATYTADYAQGRVRFAADTAGSALYLTGRSYDLHAAAREVWLAKAAALASGVDFSADGASFNMRQKYEQALSMAEQMARKVGFNHQRGDVRVAPIVRSDLARW